MIASELAAARKSRGHTQEVAARELGCSLKSIRNWESGAHEPTGLNRRAVEEYIADAKAAQ